MLGYSALDGGLALLPMTAAIMLLMVGFTARAVNRFGFKSNLVVGLVLLAVALSMFAMAPVGGSFLVHVLPASLIAAVAMSLAYIPATIAAMSGAKPEETGLASGLVNTSYQLGSALGLAAMVAVAASKTASLGGAVAGAEALNEGFRAAFVAAAVIAAVGAAIAAVAIRVPRAAGTAESSELRPAA